MAIPHHLAAIALRESAGGYRQHDPTGTLLYHVVREHLASFLEHAKESHGRPLPVYVEQELRAYLDCGIHANGFGRARCRDCGRELLVAFSCQKLSVCPSCNARRMCGTAAHLVDHVVPDVRVRQWVLSVPYELRLTLARDAVALSAVGRIFVEEIFRRQRDLAGFQGIEPHQVRGGAVQFPQRFGGSLTVNVHYHVVVADGVFVVERDADGEVDDVCFRSSPRPTVEELATIAHNTSVRAILWLKRKGLLQDLDEAEFSDERTEWSALDACLRASLGLGELTALPPGSTSGQDACDVMDPVLPQPTKSARRGGHSGGFDIHAGVTVASNDPAGRERLFRYCARPPLSLQRLSQLPDGRLAYALRKPWGRQTHRVMAPLEFMARLAALVPPPRHPLIRFHGVFAPHSQWRGFVVPRSETQGASKGAGVSLAVCGGSCSGHGQPGSGPSTPGSDCTTAPLLVRCSGNAKQGSRCREFLTESREPAAAPNDVAAPLPVALRYAAPATVLAAICGAPPENESGEGAPQSSRRPSARMLRIGGGDRSGIGQSDPDGIGQSDPDGIGQGDPE